MKVLIILTLVSGIFVCHSTQIENKKQIKFLHKLRANLTSHIEEVDFAVQNELAKASGTIENLKSRVFAAAKELRQENIYVRNEILDKLDEISKENQIVRSCIEDYRTEVLQKLLENFSNSIEECLKDALSHIVDMERQISAESKTIWGYMGNFGGLIDECSEINAVNRFKAVRFCVKEKTQKITKLIKVSLSSISEGIRKISDISEDIVQVETTACGLGFILNSTQQLSRTVENVYKNCTDKKKVVTYITV